LQAHISCPYLVLWPILLLSVIFCGKATGGGAFKYADVFKERLGVSLEKEDEMDCLVAGANFLLKVPIYLRHIPLCIYIVCDVYSGFLEMY
jgi:pantothenate kinase